MEQCILFRGYSPPNINRVMPLWKYYFKGTVQLLTELCPFFTHFISGQILLQITSDQAETRFIIRPWCWAAHIVSRLQSTKY